MIRSRIAVVALLAIAVSGSRGESVEFNRDIRPILSNHCFKCHGPDDEAREADLRLDQFDAASAELPSGATAIVPKHPELSELVKRILTDDADALMPPASTNKPLRPEDKEKLQQWIAEGAPYAPHWAFVPPTRPPLPTVRQPDRLESPIDAFIADRIDREGMTPAPPADRETLLRRLSLDLTGLPPTVEELDTFLNRVGDDVVEREVDRLLASPRYGERWARRWLDLARYADTNGYEKDRVRSIWPYRDWVITSLNADVPFDRFTVEQLAGDMLPEATLSQRIATGFHRNTMLNEEGGVDPLEFRFHSMVDRVNTTGTIWLGLTVGCAQCHTHKYDPITQRDYYQLMAFLNNADEPEMPVPNPDIEAQRNRQEAKLNGVAPDPARYPVDPDELDWEFPIPTSSTSAGKATTEILQDGSVRVSGAKPAKDTLTIEWVDDASEVVALRIETLTDPSLPAGGPGRVKHGNFVLSEIRLQAEPLSSESPSQNVEFLTAGADVEQEGFAAWQAIDGRPDTGWAVARAGVPLNQDRQITAHFAKPVSFAGGTRWRLELQQNHGDDHTLGRVRVQLGRLKQDSPPIEFLRREHFDRDFTKWREQEEPYATHWKHLAPIEATSNLPYLTILEDASILSSGDQSKSDTYQIRFRASERGVTALRLEAMTDPRLPRGGPGRIYYEGPFGDFFLSEVTLLADGAPVKIRRVVASYSSGAFTPDRIIDGDPQSGWSINGAQGRPHVAIFELEEAVDIAESLDLKMLFEKYYACGLGRFRWSVTSDLREDRPSVLPADVEDLLASSQGASPPAPSSELLDYFTSISPAFALARHRQETIRGGIPEFPTTLVMQERPNGFPRPTRMHHRGEFLQPKDVVSSKVPEFIGLPTASGEASRLALAHWLVDPSHPLTPRVTVNRIWAALFGKGIVRTTEDFGYQGEPPTHPELLDWLALEWPEHGWSMKDLQRMLVTSATYRQSSHATPEGIEKDSGNRLLARGPRVRLEAELIRDSILAVSGLLSSKIGGPSVFPPQPAGITSEGTYGPLAWTVSTGEDRYRRGLYTFAKRTAPFAMFNTFDSPSGEACVDRREVSNTPLQALTLLNDELTMEAARELGKQWGTSTQETRVAIGTLFRQCLGRRPAPAEEESLVSFFEAQRARIASGELKADVIAPSAPANRADCAAWTLVARAILNLDEMITKE